MGTHAYKLQMNKSIVAKYINDLIASFVSGYKLGAQQISNDIPVIDWTFTIYLDSP